MPLRGASRGASDAVGSVIVRRLLRAVASGATNLFRLLLLLVSSLISRLLSPVATRDVIGARIAPISNKNKTRNGAQVSARMRWPDGMSSPEPPDNNNNNRPRKKTNKKRTVRPISGSPSVAGGHEEQVKRWEESRPSSSSRAVGFLEQVQRTWLPTRQHHSQSHVASGRLPQLQKLTVDITERMRCFSVIPTASAMIICRRLSSQKIKKASRYADHRLIPRVHQCKRAAEVRPRATRSLLQSHQHLITPKEKEE